MVFQEVDDVFVYCEDRAQPVHDAGMIWLASSGWHPYPCINVEGAGHEEGLGGGYRK